MRLKTFDELNENSISLLVWTVVANDIIKDLFNKTGDFTTNGETFDKLIDAVDSVLYNARSTPSKHKCVSVEDYGIYTDTKIDDLAKEFGFKEVKLGTKLNKHGEIYILVKSKKLTKGFMKMFYKDPYFQAGKILY